MPEERNQTPPGQTQTYPGTSGEMTPEPRDEMRDYQGRDLLKGKRALITGGDSGIGRAVAVAFAKEGADVAIAYLSESEDAEHTRKLVEQEGRRCLLLPGDLSRADQCVHVVEQTVGELGGLDVLVNNVAYQQPVDSLDELDDEQWQHTFAVNIHSYFRVTKAALRHMGDGAAIVNTSSINGLRGNKTLIDYSATKGAINAFTQAMAQNLVDKGIRVNAVAPGPVWTPLIPATFPPEKVDEFGKQTPMKRAADPDEIAPSYVFFASGRLSSYYTGEVLAPIGGETLPG
ncbi:SDR family oxidoreductase [Herbidospora galbida]|uniref:SDR family oxidoreductase n=1 Tax=Herbidospora galbida TaxID=2575442 RepID=A0A4U3MPZ4_9ACTN|nr:SDR family oxidoreductase [Herbidospora galbida]TKK90834.1 SDR family oxidoreductase [Herbidospora galbida]